MDALVEAHDEEEVQRALGSGAKIIGVNNRDLRTFATDPRLSATVARELPENVVKVAESGITSLSEVRRLRDVGFSGFLIGERFMREADPGKALREFLHSNP